MKVNFITKCAKERLSADIHSVEDLKGLQHSSVVLATQHQLCMQSQGPKLKL